MNGVRDVSVKRELRKALYNNPDITFFELHELARELFPEREQRNLGECDPDYGQCCCVSSHVRTQRQVYGIDGLSEAVCGVCTETSSTPSQNPAVS